MPSPPWCIFNLKVFQTIDKDGDGTLTLDELTDVLSALDENAFHIEDVQVSGGERVGERERGRV